MSGNVTKKRGLKIKEVSRSSEYSGIDQNPLTHTRFVVRFNEGKNLLASDVLTGKSDPICFVWFGRSTVSPDPDDAGEGYGCRILRTKVCRTTLDPIWNDELVFPLDASEMSSWSDMKCVIYVRDEDEDVKDPEIKTYDELGMVMIPLADFIAKGKALRESIVRSAEWYTLQLTPKTKQNPSGMRVVDGSIKLTVSLVLGAADVEAIRTQVRDNAMLDAASAPIGQRPPSLAQQVQAIIRGVPNRPSTASPDRRRPSSASSTRSSLRSDSVIRVVAPMAPRPSTAKPQRSSDLSLESPLAYALPEETDEGDLEESIAVVDEAGEPNNDATRSELTVADLTAWKRDIRVQVDDRDVTDLLGLDPEGGDQCGLIEELVKIGLNAVKDNVADYVKDNIADFVRDNVADRGADALGSMLNAALLTGTKVAELIKSRSEELAKELSADGDILSAVNEAVKEKLSQLGSDLHLFKPSSRSSHRLDDNHQGVPSAAAAAVRAAEIDLDQEEPGMMLFGDQNGNAPDNVDDQLSGKEVAGKPTDSADSKGSATDMVAVTTDVSSMVSSSIHRNPAPITTNESAVAAAGNAVNVVRALKEMSIDRRRLEQTVQRIASAAEAGFTKLSERLTRIEDSLLAATTRGDGRSTLDGEPPIGDQLIVTSQEEKSQGDRNPKQGNGDAGQSAVGSKRSRLNVTAPANLEAKAVSRKATRTGTVSSVSGDDSTSGRQRFGSTTAIADAKRRYAEARRQPTQQESTANAGDNVATMPSSHSRKESSFDSTKQQQQQQQGMELVYKGVDGKIASSAVVTLNEDPYDGSPASDAMGLRRLDHQSDQQNYSNSGSYYPVDKRSFSPASASATGGFHSDDRLAEPASSSHRYGAPPASSPPGQRFHLNREFSEVLERGSLEDVARLIVSTAPQPEALSALVRNRLFDAIATLLHRNSSRSHTERCLLWVLALVRGQPGLVEEVAGHTRRDLKDALDRVALEPSKRGLLASLLKTQIVSQQMTHR